MKRGKLSDLFGTPAPKGFHMNKKQIARIKTAQKKLVEALTMQRNWIKKWFRGWAQKIDAKNAVKSTDIFLKGIDKTIRDLKRCKPTNPRMLIEFNKNFDSIDVSGLRDAIDHAIGLGCKAGQAAHKVLDYPYSVRIGVLHNAILDAHSFEGNEKHERRNAELEEMPAPPAEQPVETASTETFVQPDDEPTSSVEDGALS